jgi:hypothetical protein
MMKLEGFHRGEEGGLTFLPVPPQRVLKHGMSDESMGLYFSTLRLWSLSLLHSFQLTHSLSFIYCTYVH